MPVVATVTQAPPEVSWWRPSRVVLAALLAVMVAAVAFTYRFNALGGALGGFDDDHFAHLARTEVMLRGEQPLRDFVDAELRGAWPALSYMVPAWAQQLGGRSLLPEAVLTVGAIAFAHVLTFLLALDLSRRWSVALLVAAVAVLTAPKLYNYPKVLMLAMGAVAIRVAMANPNGARLALAAAVTAIAALFRHDYGVYLAVGMVTALIARDAGAWSLLVRRLGLYVGLTAAFLVPSAVWVQVYEGIPAYLRNALATAGVETGRTALRLPAIDAAAPFGGDSLIVATYYAFWIALAIAAAALVWRLTAAGTTPLTPRDRATAVGLLATAVIVNQFFLRANLSQRFGDAIVPVALAAAWTIGAAPQIGSMAVRRLATVVPLVLLMVMCGSAYVVGDAARELDTTGLSDSWGKVSRRFVTARDDLARLPPAVWTAADAAGTLQAARYVAECTGPDDRVLVAAYAPEIPVFARRGFAAGQPTVSLSLYTSEADQRRALGRLERQSVPVVVADADGFEDEFVTDYPLLAQYVSDHYHRAGTITVDDDPRFLVFVEADRQPRRAHEELGLPCFR